MIALETLQKQLVDLGICSRGSNLALYPNFMTLFKNSMPYLTYMLTNVIVWANNADAISTQYSGTRALKNDITRYFMLFGFQLLTKHWQEDYYGYER